MPAIVDLIDRATAERLAAVRAGAAEAEHAAAEAAAATPVRPVCRACGQPVPPPPAVFREAR